MDDVFIGRQPILDRNQKIFAYELLFRSGHTQAANVVDNVRATAAVMVNTLNNMGIKRLIGEKKGFLNVDDAILKSGIVELLPKNQTVLEILETVQLTDEIIDLCRGLKRKGYRLALDDFVYHESWRPMLELADYVKIDVLAYDRAEIKHLKHRLDRYRFEILAEKVETKEDFQHFLDMGFKYFQGYFFARPSVITAKSISTTHMVLIELMRLLSTEAELHAIEQLFRKNPELQIKLLQLMNSASYYTAQKITSIRQSITYFGYRKLQKWVTLLLFAGTGDDLDTNPLLERAAVRGRVAELLARRVSANETVSDSAFIAGVLSLIDVLLSVPMDLAVTELNLSEEIKDALLGREGFLGTFISITEGLEKDTFEETGRSMEKLGLTLQDLFSMEREAIIEYENYKDDQG